MTTAQTPQPVNMAGKTVDAPAIMVGDSYTYESENISNSKLSYVATREVTAIDDNRLTLVTTNVKSGSKRTSYYDRVWGYLGSGSGNNDGVSFSPALKYLDFPLNVGKKWTAYSTETDKKTGHQRQHTINGTVEGWEKVQVPAGEYDALKIVLKTEVKDADNVSPGTDVSWYVPALRRSVKSELSGLDVSTGGVEKRIVRLLSYHIDYTSKSISPDTANKSLMQHDSKIGVSKDNNEIDQRNKNHSIINRVEESKRIEADQMRQKDQKKVTDGGGTSAFVMQHKEENSKQLKADTKGSETKSSQEIEPILPPKPKY